MSEASEYRVPKVIGGIPVGPFFFFYILWLWHDAKLDQLSSEVDFNNFLICLLNLLSYVWISSFISIIIS